ncbi:MAG: AMP-binding protein [Prolixibacteraceae bacterium]|jgi:long-chain acyl-CoA synthetase|nr:AMP-binding protein [Prolixibacteraceae bacterium]
MKKPIINRAYPDKKALITSKGDITYKQLLKQIQQFALLFENKAYSKVAIYAENSTAWICAFYAALQNNCIAIPIDFLAAADDVAYIIDDCNPELLFISSGMKESFEKINAKTNHKPELIVFENISLDENISESQWLGPDDDDTTAVIIYTSGTTGSPKGVMLSYTNLIENVNAVIDAKIYIPEREVMIFLPLHHVFPLVGSMLTPFYVGSPVVMVPSMQSSDLMKSFAENQVGVFMGVPRLYELMYRGIKAKIDKSMIARTLLKLVLVSKNRKLGKKLFKKVHESFGGHLQYMIAGGAALNKEVGTFFYALGFDILEGFGMTEAAPMITFPRPGRVKIGSTGEALPSLEVEIRKGEIVAKGPSIMKGYYNRPEETAEVLKDGWLHSGDLGHFDEEGFLYITGRIKEIIVLPNGKNINPVEVEMKLDGFSPAIKEAGVFMQNDMLHAVIFPNLNYLVENGVEDFIQYFRDEIITPFNAEISSYKRIMQFTLVKSELPRTRLSKLQRFKLVEMLEQKESKKDKSDEPETTEYRAIKSFIESQVDMDIRPDDHLIFDISMDSLGKLSLIDFIEKSFGLNFNEEELQNFPSIRKMAEHIQKNKLFHKAKDQSTWSGDLKDDSKVILPQAPFLLKPGVRFVRGLFRLFFKFEGKGMENIPEGPCFLAPNHESKLDAFLVLSYLDRTTLKNTYSYAKNDHVKSGIRRYLARHSNVIVMDLSKDLKHSIQKMAEVVKQGKKILIFPEGTRTLNGKLGKFKKTYAILSSELNIPIVPVAISGAYAAMSSGSKKIKKGEKITIEFLPAIFPEKLNSIELNDLIKGEIKKAKKLKS